jgi:hypothetical protein
MSNYLSNLVARNLSGMEVIQPRLPSLFEPIQGVSGSIAIPEFGLEQQIVDPPVEEFKQIAVPSQMNAQISAVSQLSTERSATSDQHVNEISQQSLPIPPVPMTSALEDTRLVSPINQSSNDLKSNSSPLMSSSETIQPTTISSRLTATDNEAIRSIAPAAQRQKVVPKPTPVQEITAEHKVIEHVVPAEKPSFPEHHITSDPVANLALPTTDSANNPVANLILPTTDSANNPVANLVLPSTDLSNNPVANLLTPIINHYTEQPVQSSTKPASMPEERPVLRHILEQIILPHQVIPTVRSLGLEIQKPSPLPQTVPTIQVTIGRIEVRAILPSTPAPVHSRSKPTVMSLEEYLRQRGGGR